MSGLLQNQFTTEAYLHNPRRHIILFIRVCVDDFAGGPIATAAYWKCLFGLGLCFPWAFRKISQVTVAAPVSGQF